MSVYLQFNRTHLSYQGRTIAKIVLSVSEHPNSFTQISWEGLYVALSRVKFRDDIRLLLKDGDRSTMDYIENLTKNAHVQIFFDDYEGDMQMTWNKERAAESAGIG